MTGFLIATGIWWGAWAGVMIYLRRERFALWSYRAKPTPEADLCIIDAAGKPADRPGPIEWSEDVYGGKSWKGLQPGDRVYVGDHLVFLADAPQARMRAA